MFNKLLAQKNKQHEAEWKVREAGRVKKEKEEKIRIDKLNESAERRRRAENIRYLHTIGSSLFKKLHKTVSSCNDITSITQKINISARYKKAILNDLLKNKLAINANTYSTLKDKYLRTFKNASRYDHYMEKWGWLHKKKLTANVILPYKVRLKQNVNTEVNTSVYAYTIIKKEFMFAPKFQVGKPVAFTYRINRFIKHFF